jgi:predicted Zn-dependent protease
VVALLDDSDRKLQAGQQEAAAAAVERALRISPSNALLWYRLAAIRVGQGQWSQAEALAQKSLSLSGNDVQLQSDNWKLIARARRELGDAAGARAAENAASRAAASAVQ